MAARHHTPGPIPPLRTGLGPLLVRAAALGVAAGCRGSLGLSAPVLAGTSAPLAKGAAALGTVGELVGDKLPRTPSRLLPPGPQARAVAGALGGALLARAAARPLWAPALVGALASAAGTWGGAAWRGWAGRRGPDWPAALAEDAVALGLAFVATRR